MNLVELLNNLVASIAELQLKLADVPASIEVVAKENYDLGFLAGAASVVVEVPSDKIYSQVELDSAIALAILPLAQKIAELELVVSGFDVKIKEAVIAFKAELLAKYKEAQVVELQIETGFEELLK